MKKYQRLFARFSIVSGLCFLGFGCGSGTTSGSGGGTTVSITGTVSANSSDLGLSSPQVSTHLKRGMKNGTLPSADTAVAEGMTVTVTKVNADATTEEVTGVTATTDASGNYTLAGLDPVTTTDGAADFYYKITATDGTIVLDSITAPTEDETVPVSPGTNLASDVLEEIVGGQPPSPEVVEAIRELVKKNAEDDLSESSTIPSASDTEATLGFANGISTAGGDAEKMYKASKFESEAFEIIADPTTDADTAAAYVKQAILQGCNQDTSTNPIPVLGAEVMGEEMVAGTTYTPTQVVEAYNAASGENVVAATAASSFAEILTDIDTNYTAGAADAEGLSTADQVALYVKRGLVGSTFSVDTPLMADQALAFLQTLEDSQNPCGLSVDVNAVIAELTSSAELESPAISQVQIYNDSTGDCSAGSNEGHFRGSLEVYIPAESDVTVVSTRIVGTNGIDASGSLSGNSYIFTLTGPSSCVTFEEDVTYTVSVTLSSGGPLTTTVDRNHALVPEAITTLLDGTALSSNSNSPTLQPDKRPAFAWTDPETLLAQIPNAPAGSKIKYTYEFSHMLVGGGGPLSNTVACPSINGGGTIPLYELSNVMPSEDCQVDLCATEQATTPDQIVCRMNIQTFLVDEYDNYLGQAAGNFRFFGVE